MNTLKTAIFVGMAAAVAACGSGAPKENLSEPTLAEFEQMPEVCRPVMNELARSCNYSDVMSRRVVATTCVRSEVSKLTAGERKQFNECEAQLQARG